MTLPPRVSFEMGGILEEAEQPSEQDAEQPCLQLAQFPIPLQLSRRYWSSLSDKIDPTEAEKPPFNDNKSSLDNVLNSFVSMISFIF